MKVGKQYLGKDVVVTWRDPGSTRVKSHPPGLTDLPKGVSALATWVERGLLDDLTDGVLRIRHSDGSEPGATTPDEFEMTWVPEALVERIVVMKVDYEEPRKEPNAEPQRSS